MFIQCFIALCIHTSQVYLIICDSVQGAKDVFRLHMGLVKNCYLQYVFDPSMISLQSV